MFLAAAVQMTSLSDKAANLATALRLVDEAAARGASLVALPENVLHMGSDRERAAAAEPLDGPSLARFAEAAARLRIDLLVGSVPEAGGPDGRVYNTSVLFGPEGRCLAAYRKIHLFDVDLPDGVRYRESEAVAPGDEPVLAETALGRIGLSVCYDLRFPELYRELSARGAEILCVPAAFTAHTGKDHWEVLLRARAIENLAYVIAPAQHGRHTDRRVTWGRALIANPWGTVLATAADGEGFALAPVDLAYVAQVRREIPALRHRRL